MCDTGPNICDNEHLCRISQFLGLCSELVGLSELGMKTSKFANSLTFKVTWNHLPLLAQLFGLS